MSTEDWTKSLWIEFAATAVVLVVFYCAYWRRWSRTWKRNIYSTNAPVWEPIIASIVLGIGLVILLLGFYKGRCAGVGGGVCKMVVDSPPWLLLSGVAAAPPFLLTWYWRTVHKQADIQKGIDDIAKGKIDIENSKVELSLAQNAHVSDRFCRAVELLGNEKAEIRLGGIYALERVAMDSRRDLATVANTLASYVRLYAPRIGDTERRIIAPRMATDVQAVLTMLGRCRSGEKISIDLGHTNLCGALLSGDFSGASFTHADMQNAALIGANLRGADLLCADLRGAALDKANMKSAWLDGARLENAYLDSADLTDAVYDDETKFSDDFDPVKRGMVHR